MIKQTNIDELCNLLDTLPNPVTLNELAYDNDGNTYDKILYVNTSFLKEIGYTTQDIPDDKTWFLKAYPDTLYQEYITQEWFKCINKSKKENSSLIGFPAEISCKNGNKKWFNVTTQIEHSIQNKYRTIVFIETQTPEKIKLDLDKKSLQLKEERLLLKTILNTLPVRVFYKDINGVYLGCNTLFLNDAQLNEESEIIGKSDYDLVWTDQAHLYREDDQSVQNSGVSKLNYVERQTQSEGKTIIVSTSKVPLKDHNGKVIGILGIYQDITQEYEAQEAFSRQEKLMIIQSRQAQIGEMMSMIAHQWRQPLASISAIAGTLSIDVIMDEYKKDFFQERLQSINEISQHLSSTINDFRDFYKPNKKKVTVKLEEVIKKSLNIISGSLLNDNIEIIKEYNSKKEIELYDNELMQVILNILKNAQDNFKEKHIENPYIKITTENATISISDNGGGIPENILENIFDPYFTTKDEKNGTGLGLYMSKTIIEEHHKGKLSVQNTDDGVCFKIECGIHI